MVKNCAWKSFGPLSVSFFICLLNPSSVSDSTWSFSLFPVHFSSFLYTLPLAKKSALHCKHSLWNSCPSVKGSMGFWQDTLTAILWLWHLQKERGKGRAGEMERKRERDCPGCSSFHKHFQLKFTSKKFQLNLIISSSKSLLTHCPPLLQLPMFSWHNSNHAQTLCMQSTVSVHTTC